jgi:hypothetical protein
MAYDPNRYMDPALQRFRGRGGFGLGGPTYLGAAPAPTAIAPAGGTRLGGLAQGQRMAQPGVVGMSGNFRMGAPRAPIIARPSARNSAEYYANRDAVAGNPLDNLELGNRDMMRQAYRLMARGQGGNQSMTPSGASRFNAATGRWEGASLPQNQTIEDIEAGRVAARAEEEDAALLMQDAQAQEIEDRRMNAYLRSGGRAQVTDEMDVPTSIGGLPADLYWQREANRGMSSNVSPMPGFQGIPYQPTAAGGQYLNRLTGLYNRGIR